MGERCPKGHDRRVVGTLADGTCRECSQATRRRYHARVRAGQPVALKNPVCPKGHDKRLVGTTSGMCALCYAAINRKRMRRWRERTGRTPAVVPNLRAVRQALGFKEFARFAGISESHLANQGNTPYDEAVTLRVWTGIGEVIPPAVERVLGEQTNRSSS